MTRSYLTMNDADDDTRREYNAYQLEVLRLEFERDEQMRHIRASDLIDRAEDVLDDGYDSYDADADWDEWLDDVYSSEELERAQREQDEVRDDH